MYYVYIIRSLKDDYLYTGCTSNLKSRLREHNAGQSLSTYKHKPFMLIYYEAFLDMRDALDREKKLKHHGSVIGHLKKRLKYSLR